MTNNCELNDILLADRPAVAASASDQQEVRERYEEQQRRLCCPSCGEEPYLD
jgi:hypothetical protein